MKHKIEWSFLCLFGTEVEGEAEQTPDHTPQSIDETGATESVPAAEEQATAKTRQEEFRALMEGEYKELFTAYFQETFNRRFREQKGMKQELDRAKETLGALAAHFGVEVEQLPEAVRTENERKIASTEALEKQLAASAEREAEFEKRMAAAVDEAIENTRIETERALLADIRARGMRPIEAGLGDTSRQALRSDAAHLSRAQRAEVARRAARGERIKF
ncbi:MAG: hypothetical protein IJW22_08685 [Clostridia bacterium]|nr:hypothetical protein [Clostridia bacterium]